jgi:hypothetical protein
MDASSEKLIADFISAHLEGREVKGEDPRFASIMELDRLAHDEPERAWLLLLQILERDNSTHVLEMLAAGPLEDLIQYHGPAFIERIESQAKANPVFRHALGGVWESSTPEIWKRVEKVRGSAW